MNRPTTTVIDLPIGSKSGWELESDDTEELKGISVSCVLLHALRQSREKWLFSTFPRFSTKARGGKATEQAPPPHTIQNRGRCDVEIGPHIFPDTIFYEVHYLPPHPQPVACHSHLPPTGSWQSKTPYTALAQPSPTSVSASNTFDLEKSSQPLISSLTVATTITPTLINQVNSAASSNPTLANLLQLAAAGLATPEQLKTLGLLIQSLATAESTHIVPPSFSTSSQPPSAPVVSPATSTTVPPSTPIKEFDLVLEFRDSPSERWLFPRGLVTCERTLDSPITDATSHIVIKTCLPFSNTNPLNATVAIQTPPNHDEVQIVTLRLRKTPLAVWDTISRWAGDERKMEENRSRLGSINTAEHVYLGYHLPDGPLLNQLQVASAPTFTMKSLKASAGNGSRTRRKAIAKPKIDLNTLQAQDTTEKHVATKRRRINHPDRSSVTPIQCVSCKNKDVPLILGGRFCRPCVEAGHATGLLPPYRFSSYVPTSVPVLTKEPLQPNEHISI